MPRRAPLRDRWLDLAAGFLAAFYRLDPWPYCRSYRFPHDPDGEGHAAACRRWRS